MKNQIFITTILSMALIVATSGEDPNGKENSAMQRILAIPAEKLFPGSRALEDLEGQTNLLTNLCQNWTLGKTPDERIRLLRFAVALGISQSQTKRFHFRLSDDGIAKALIEGLDAETEDIRSTAANLFEKQFDERTVSKFGPHILEVVRKRKNSDAILLLGRTGMKEAALLLQEEKAFRSASERQTQLALAKLGNKEYETKFIGQYTSAKDPADKLRFARDLAYVGTEIACKTLAEDLRTSDEVKAGGLYSLRVFIIDALSRSFPDAAVLQPPDPLSLPKDDTYYEKIEQWAEEKFNISWNKPRPPFFYMMPLPIKGPTLPIKGPTSIR